MKLRLRSFESKETLKIETPNSCSLPQLKQIVSQALPNLPSPASVRLSLNRKDELQSDGSDSLHSLGIAAGDLIFYSIEQPAGGVSSNSQNSIPLEADSTPEPGSKGSECSTSLTAQNTLPEAPSSDCVILDSQKGKILDGGSEMEVIVDDMEVDDEGNETSYDGLLPEVVDKSFSVPGFLRKVFMEELGDDSGRNHKLIVIAVHAVMLESGFVGFDKIANVVVRGFQFHNEWPTGLFRVSLFYTLPQSPSGALGEANKSVVLKFQSLGKFINVYGTLGNGSGKRGTYWVQLNEDELVPFLNVVWANCGVTENISGKDGSISGTSPEKEVFKFWRTVKDKLALPLLIDLCEEAGLELPPCFMRLPTDLKLKILECLPGVDVAKVSCACSELRYLGSSDDLWRLKFAEEFGNEKEAQGSWKNAFATVWDWRKSRKRASRVRASPYWPAPYWPQSRRRGYGMPFMAPQVPRIIGGEYDIGPVIGNDIHTMLDGGSVNHPMRNFSPRCNLGVRGVLYNIEFGSFILPPLLYVSSLFLLKQTKAWFDIVTSPPAESFSAVLRSLSLPLEWSGSAKIAQSLLLWSFLLFLNVMW
ncbi:F-box protein SKIP22 [Sesamum alatum]|uniref:F-box protein SKIP22 n=1 Tax=Sesamum alatum TaxID=300844 RepID=A0AAE2CXE0_9LAMI|nr:F-box protein SKIP22 [Sesamum alatum]